GILCGIVGAIIGGNLGGPENPVAFGGMRGYEATGVLGLIVGVVLGGSAGVYLGGRRSRVPGSYAATLMAAIVAVLVGAVLLLASGGVKPGNWLLNTHPLMLPMVFLMTLLGSMLGFELARSRMQPAAGEVDQSPGL
ncbi:MAG TPA: hypothetical protein VEZ12_24225, partial [Herpetosiphonaceae bacterium]|nr:hypothetical protein [Herpetosiphonaceae bacterium]